MSQAINEVFTSLLSNWGDSNPLFYLLSLCLPLAHCSGPSSFQECLFSAAPAQVLLAQPGWVQLMGHHPSSSFECFFWDCSSPEGSHVHLPPHFWAPSLCCHVPTVFSFCEYSAFQIRLWVTHEVGAGVWRVDTLSLEKGVKGFCGVLGLVFSAQHKPCQPDDGQKFMRSYISLLFRKSCKNVYTI